MSPSSRFYSCICLMMLFGTGSVFGWSSQYKGDSARFSWVVSGYPTSTIILQVDGLSTDTREWGVTALLKHGNGLSGGILGYMWQFGSKQVLEACLFSIL